MSVLFGLAFGLKQSPLSPIQVLYSNLICAITLGFVAAIEPAEDGIMSLPPRRIGKRLIGRYLLLRILLGTFTLTLLVVSSAFWLKSYNKAELFSYYDCSDPFNPINDDNSPFSGFDCKTFRDSDDSPLKYYLEDIRACAFNVLDFGAISVTLSARFTYLSSIHPRVFYGNKYAWYSVFIVAILQIMITYIPGLNNVVFQMRGMDGIQWGITIFYMVIVFLVMEAEKAVRRHLKFKGEDVDDRQYGVFDNPMEGEATDDALLPKGASNLNLVSLEK
jgi:magnesium-transporting ATPase (P-type)